MHYQLVLIVDKRRYLKNIPKFPIAPNTLTFMALKHAIDHSKKKFTAVGSDVCMVGITYFSPLDSHIWVKANYQL